MRQLEPAGRSKSRPPSSTWPHRKRIVSALRYMTRRLPGFQTPSRARQCEVRSKQQAKRLMHPCKLSFRNPFRWVGTNCDSSVETPRGNVPVREGFWRVSERHTIPPLARKENLSSFAQAIIRKSFKCVAISCVCFSRAARCRS